MPSLAEWHVPEWGHLKAGEWNAVRPLRRNSTSSTATAPCPPPCFCWKRISLLGSVSLVSSTIFPERYPEAALNPGWPASMCMPEHRSRGIGTELVRRSRGALHGERLEKALPLTEKRQALLPGGFSEVPNPAPRFPVSIMRSPLNRFEPPRATEGSPGVQTPVSISKPKAPAGAGASSAWHLARPPLAQPLPGAIMDGVHTGG